MGQFDPQRILFTRHQQQLVEGFFLFEKFEAHSKHFLMWEDHKNLRIVK